MPRTSALLAALFLAAAVPALGATALSVKEQMKQTVDPASNTLFAVGGEVDPQNAGEEPTPNARWAEAKNAAQKLADVAASLNEPGRAKEGDDWKVFVKQMSDTANAAVKAAARKDGDGLSKAANDLSDACAACHTKYKPQTG